MNLCICLENKTIQFFLCCLRSFRHDITFVNSLYFFFIKIVSTEKSQKQYIIEINKYKRKNRLRNVDIFHWIYSNKTYNYIILTDGIFSNLSTPLINSRIQFNSMFILDVVNKLTFGNKIEKLNTQITLGIGILPRNIIFEYKIIHNPRLNFISFSQLMVSC